MASKPENTFIAGVHRQFKAVTPYFEKTNNPYRGGTPDVYYSGAKGTMWIEYKYIPKIPRSNEILPDLTSLQQRWLNDRYEEGRDVFVVLGTPEGGVIFRNREWEVPLTSDQLRAKLLTRAQIADWIAEYTGPSKCNS